MAFQNLIAVTTIFLVLALSNFDHLIGTDAVTCPKSPPNCCDRTSAEATPEHCTHVGTYISNSKCFINSTECTDNWDYHTCTLSYGKFVMKKHNCPQPCKECLNPYDGKCSCYNYYTGGYPVCSNTVTSCEPCPTKQNTTTTMTISTTTTTPTTTSTTQSTASTTQSTTSITQYNTTTISVPIRQILQPK